MTFTIQIYYDLQNQFSYNNFYNNLLKHYLELGYTSTYDKNYSNKRISKLLNNEYQEIIISAIPLVKIKNTQEISNIIYIQNSIISKINKDIITYFNTLNPKEVDIYTFDKEGVIGVWNIN